MALVEKPRRERVLIRPLSPEQATVLLDQPDAGNVEGLRDRAMMVLMLDSGLRVSEVTAVGADRVDWLRCCLTVMGKGRKERLVPFSARSGQILLEYARARAQGSMLAPNFFLGRTGRALERNKIRKLVLRYGRKAGIQGVRISPHTLRHYLCGALCSRRGRFLQPPGDPRSYDLGHDASVRALGASRHRRSAQEVFSDADLPRQVQGRGPIKGLSAGSRVSEAAAWVHCIIR